MPYADLKQITLADALADPDPLFGPSVPSWASEGARGVWAIVRDYWREEVQRESVAIGRLERICEQKGWDYTATRRALS